MKEVTLHVGILNEKISPLFLEDILRKKFGASIVLEILFIYKCCKIFKMKISKTQVLFFFHVNIISTKVNK